jgi:uncharacterized protein YegP (UPF0339 family)
VSLHKWLAGFGVVLVLLVAPAGGAGPALGQLRAAQGARGLKFEIYQDAAKEYRWRLKAGNGEILATAGQGYKAKVDCQKGVERIKENVASDKLKFEVYQDKAMEFRWRLKAANGQVVGSSSQGYKKKADCEHAIDLIKESADKAEVKDMT